MHKDFYGTCPANVLLTKPFVWWPSRCRCDVVCLSSLILDQSRLPKSQKGLEIFPPVTRSLLMGEVETAYHAFSPPRPKKTST